MEHKTRQDKTRGVGSAVRVAHLEVAETDEDEHGLHRINRLLECRNVLQILDIQPRLEPWHHHLQPAAEHSHLILG